MDCGVLVLQTSVRAFIICGEHRKTFFMLFIPCIALQSTCHPTRALYGTPFMTYHLLRV